MKMKKEIQTLNHKKATKPVTVVHTCNPDTWDAEAEGQSSRPAWARY
jgi:hypothetical protein